jgi:hypothetical protein
MMKNILLVAVLFFICSCGNTNSIGEGSTTTAVTMDSINRDKTLVIDAFSSSPADSDGIGCFYYDIADSANELFAQGLDGSCYISVNHKLQHLIADTTSQDELYKNELYELRIDIKETGVTDGGNSYEGTMTIKNRNGKVTTKKIFGNCGC